jgi:prepilin-type processing-associated H-X9-DG protein
MINQSVDREPHPATPRASSGCNVVAAIFSFTMFALIGLAALPACFNLRYREEADQRNRQSCLSNVKQIGTAFDMYLQDYDDRLPPNSDWTSRLFPYLRNERLLQCPSVAGPEVHDYSRTSGLSSFGYAYNSKLAEATQKEIGNAKSRVLIYDSTNLARDASDLVTSLPDPPRHQGRNNIGYADGHARSESPSRAAP